MLCYSIVYLLGYCHLETRLGHYLVPCAHLCQVKVINILHPCLTSYSWQGTSVVLCPSDRQHMYQLIMATSYVELQVSPLVCIAIIVSPESRCPHQNSTTTWGFMCKIINSLITQECINVFAFIFRILKKHGYWHQKCLIFNSSLITFFKTN